MSFRSTVLVYEFFSGGGYPIGELPGGLATEALGMLWALLTDFRRWGLVRTLTALDPRFEERVPGLNRSTLPADEVVEASREDHREIYLSLLKRCDTAIVIAPESDNILAWFTAQAELKGVPVLGSAASAVAAAGNKAECHKLFSKAGLPNPKTQTVSFDRAPQAATEIGFPLVIKPVDGVGCEGVYMVNQASGLDAALKCVCGVTSRNEILVQSVARGAPASASLMISGDRCLPLSLNRQLIEAGSPFRYSGSEVPFSHGAAKRAVDLACSAVNLIPGLRGYVGVDLVLADDSVLLIEINPRLTTSYIGLRMVSQKNLAAAIWEACVDGILPEQVPLCGRVTIKKDDPASWNL